MANYYTDHPELEFHLHHPLMKRIVELKERNFEDKDKFEDAPVDYDDAIENYHRILEITGDIAANIIEPNSESVDLEGPHLENGRMIYASKTYEPRRHSQGRPLGYQHAPSLWWLEYSQYHLLHVVGGDFGCRCRFPECLVLAVVHRYIV